MPSKRFVVWAWDPALVASMPTRGKGRVTACHTDYRVMDKARGARLRIEELDSFDVVADRHLRRTLREPFAENRDVLERDATDVVLGVGPRQLDPIRAGQPGQIDVLESHIADEPPALACACTG
jgi:hypothetical protein